MSHVIPQQLTKCIALENYNPIDKISFWSLTKGEVIYEVSKQGKNLSVCLKGQETKLVYYNYIKEVVYNVQHPFEEGTYVKMVEMIEAHNKQFLYYYPVDQLGNYLNGHKRHYFMSCQTFENGKPCAWKEYRCDTPNDIPKRNQEFFDHLIHRCEPTLPNFQISIFRLILQFCACRYTISQVVQRYKD
ncbi:MAG: hypothetical protein EZS28_021476 [Streblomastix strix]|uniref:Uncharacterized protein n=1 Tax=Streblomastix strix TaxID=222440 RepID=A0A5J4VKY3_9EUKA|nr:MAG: hypothetical protein EZS28_021476 [Streblomastix strix]